MSSASGHVVSVSYDEFVDEFLVEEHDAPLTTVIGWLNQLGVETSGEYCIYWPADHYVIQYGLSKRAAEIMKRVFSDPRIVITPTPAVENPTFEIEKPRRDGWAGDAQLTSDGKTRPYKKDHFFYVSVQAEPAAYAAYEFTPTEQDLGTKFIYADESLTERQQRSRDNFHRRRASKA